MTRPDPEDEARRIVRDSLAGGDPTAWFEPLYAAAEAGEVVVPWDRGAPNRLLVEWADARGLDGRGRRALVVGCGLGDDAELVAARGFDTVAFDVSATAIRGARARYPDTVVDYVTADLLDPPDAWVGGFDLVVESITVQALPDPPRREAIERVAAMVAPGGTLIVISGARDEGDAFRPPPWPLTRAEIDAFASGGLRPVRIEDLRDAADPTWRRWRAEFRA